MKKQGCYGLFFLLATTLLMGCVSSVLTGVNLVYTRHHVYKKMDDLSLANQANQILFKDKALKQPGCHLDLAVFNGDVLLVGHVPLNSLRALALNRIDTLTGYRRLFKQVALSSEANNDLKDSWITAKIRSQILADSSIDPGVFKIVTMDNIVYLMGDVLPQQGIKVIAIARNTSGVTRVVKLLRYYELSEKS